MLTQEMRQLFKLFDTDGSEILRIISPPPDRAGAFRSVEKRHTIIVLRKEAEAFSRCPIFFKPKRANFQRDYEDKAEISRRGRLEFGSSSLKKSSSGASTALLFLSFCFCFCLDFSAYKSK